MGGAVLALLGPGAAGRSPPQPAVALLSGSALQRFSTFTAGVESTLDPKYVVVPQRERLQARQSADGAGGITWPAGRLSRV